MKIVENWMTIYVETTQECNLRCKFCSVWRTRDDLKKETSLNYLSKEDIEFICERLSEYMSKSHINMLLYYTGGEPFMSEYWIEMAPFLKNMGFSLAIDTNGTLLDNHYRSYVLEYFDCITFSMDGEREAHDRLRGMRGTWDKMMTNLLCLLEERNRKDESKLVIRTNTVLTSLIDKEQLNHLITKLMSEKIDEMRFKPMMYDVNSEVFKEYGLEEKKGLEILEFLWKLRENFPQINITKEYMKKTYEMIRCMKAGNWPLDIPLDCATGSHFFFVDAYGYVWPCCAFSPRPPGKSLYYTDALNLLERNKLQDPLDRIRYRSSYSCPLCNERLRQPIVKVFEDRSRGIKDE